jgi:Zn-finger nucleic acid-binding protein
MCLDCGGIRLEEDSLATTFPELLSAMASLERREADAATRTCPRCEVDMSAFVLEGLTLDACDRCAGVWIDNHEIRPFDRARAAILERGELGPTGGYRTPSASAGRAVTVTSRACEGCGKSFAESRMIESKGRTICRVCFETESEPLEVPRTVFGHLLRLVRVIR